MNCRQTVLILSLASLPWLAGCGDREATDATAPLPAPVPGATRGVPVADDEVVGTRVKAALAADGRINAGAISVSVKGGEVTLEGIVPADQITRADAIVREVPGVVEVINALQPALPAT